MKCDVEGCNNKAVDFTCLGINFCKKHIVNNYKGEIKQLGEGGKK